MSTAMTTLQRKLYLEAEIDRVEAEIHVIDARLRQGSGFGSDVVDVANDLLEWTRNLASRQLLERKLLLLRHALARLVAGGDGICEICGKHIDPDRIDAVPEATLCVSCQRQCECSRGHGLEMRRSV
jgi:DnaK suppressor protein